MRSLLLCPVVLGVVHMALSGGCGLKPVCPDDDSAVGEVPAAPFAAGGYLPYGHAHNDYAHANPLQDSLGDKLYSVEADLWLNAGEISVSHDNLVPLGTLKDLYLDPLQALVDTRGSVHGDGTPFHLWLDLKDGSPALQDALLALLQTYPMLTTFQAGGVLDGPVIVVLTGDAAAKEALVKVPGPRPFTRDSNDFGLTDPPADDTWRYYALSWGSYVGWDGNGAAPPDQRRRLACLVGAAHADGRKVRMFAAPETEASWRTQLELGVDFLHADAIDELSGFLTTYTP